MAAGDFERVTIKDTRFGEGISFESAKLGRAVEISDAMLKNALSVAKKEGSEQPFKSKAGNLGLNLTEARLLLEELQGLGVENIESMLPGIAAGRAM